MSEQLDVLKPMKTDRINLKMLTELADVTPRVLPVTSKKKHDHWGRSLKTEERLVLCLPLMKEEELGQLQAG